MALLSCVFSIHSADDRQHLHGGGAVHDDMGRAGRHDGRALARRGVRAPPLRAPARAQAPPAPRRRGARRLSHRRSSSSNDDDRGPVPDLLRAPAQRQARTVRARAVRALRGARRGVPVLPYGP